LPSPIKPLDKVFKKGMRLPLVFSSLSLFIGAFLCIVSFFFFSFIDSSVFFSKAKDKYYVVSKDVSLIHTFNKNQSYFSDREISDINKLNGVNSVSKIYSSEFPCRIHISGVANLYSEIFLEAIDNEFLSVDTIDFEWAPEQKTIPVVVSKEFLHLYNYSFSKANNLPILTKGTAKLLPLTIEIIDNMRSIQPFKAKIHDFSDRYLSILVPLDFLLWANNTYAGKNISRSNISKIIVEVALNDPSPFINYLDTNKYVVQNNKVGISENIRLVNFAIILFLFIGIAIVVVSFFFIFLSNLLLIEREEKNILKLQLLGYSLNFIRFYIFQQSIIAITIALLGSFVLGALGIMHFTEYIGGFFDFDNIKIRLFIVALSIAVLSIGIIFYSSQIFSKRMKKKFKIKSGVEN
jgi:hypothetical protein